MESKTPDRDGSGQAIKWWQRAVFYEIAPVSFQDSNGDGTVPRERMPSVTGISGPMALQTEGRPTTGLAASAEALGNGTIRPVNTITIPSSRNSLTSTGGMERCEERWPTSFDFGCGVASTVSASMPAPCSSKTICYGTIHPTRLRRPRRLRLSG